MARLSRARTSRYLRFQPSRNLSVGAGGALFSFFAGLGLPAVGMPEWLGWVFLGLAVVIAVVTGAFWYVYRDVGQTPEAREEPTPRRRAERLGRITADQRARLEWFSGFEMQIIPLENDVESMEFAHELVRLLRGCGWRVPDINTYRLLARDIGVVMTHGGDTDGLHAAQSELTAVLRELGCEVKIRPDNTAYCLEVATTDA